jgi:phage terminase large subunit-like protein
MTIKESKAYEYAKWCIIENNRYVGIYIKKQAAAWIRIVDGLDEDAFADERAFNRICKILKLMIHPDLKCSLYESLEDYAWFLIVAVLCTKLKNEKLLDIRYYVTALLLICRKNFKTFNSGVIFVLGMLIEPIYSRFFSVAPDLKLSSELQLAIRKIIKSSPSLIDEDEPTFKILRNQIKCLINDSDYIPLAYSKDGMDGKLANIYLADEAGALDNYPVEAMRSSQITLFNKLGIIISTQYPNDNNVMIDEIDMGKKTLDGLTPDKRYFSLLYEPDPEFLKEDKWKTEDLVIYQSNPVAYTYDYIFEDIKKKRYTAILYENKRENYLCKHNNIKYKGLGVEGYVEITKVRECVIKEDLDFWKGKKVYLGLDLSQTDDNTSISMVTAVDDTIYSKTFGFIPKAKKDFKSNKENVDYTKLIKQGVCFECGTEVIDYLYIENFIIGNSEMEIQGLEEKYGVEIVQIGYDRFNAISTVNKLESKGYECVEIKQHSSVLHMPTKLLKESILNKTFKYDENLMLEINFQNARCTEDTNLNKYVNKKRSSGKVDMVVALINAIYLLQQDVFLNAASDWEVQVI